MVEYPTILRKPKEALMFIKERVLRKLDGWKQNLLSMAGREVLIKSVALAVTLYNDMVQISGGGNLIRAQKKIPRRVGVS